MTSRAEDFLELVERAKRGRLKVYIGMAAGVGKTYRMLQEAHALRQRGVDVVLGFVETHGRAETEALVAGLEQVPRSRVEFRGVAVEEMDLDAVLRRRPHVAIVDELAHSNAPGGRHRKRWQDVLELVAAGINVIAAVNVQHLESLNDVVRTATGVTVRETMPDAVLAQADQVVNIDLPGEELIERFKAGKVYDAKKVEQALANFFRPDHLASLRELALREVAERVDRAGANLSAGAATDRGAGAERLRAVSGRIVVCISSRSPRASSLLRQGSRLAGRLNTDWYVVYVETPGEDPLRIDAEAQRLLHGNIEKARELGAEVVRLQGPDPAAAILDFARSHDVAHILIGRSQQPWWRQRLRGSVLTRLVRDAVGFHLTIVAQARDAADSG